MNKSPITLLSPLPPSRTGIADYVAEQLPYLEKHFEVTVVVDDTTNLTDNIDSRVLNHVEWSKERNSDVPTIHHLGNNPHHFFVFEEILKHGGIVVMHDLNNHYLINELTLAVGDWERYQSFMTEELGEIGQQITKNRSIGVFNDFLHFLIPLITPIVNAADGIIVHSDWAYNFLAEHAFDTPVTKIPMHFQPSKLLIPDNVSAIRRELGLDQNKLLLVSLGFVTPPKQVSLILEALAKLDSKIPDYEYWIVGECQDEHALEKEIADFNLTDYVHITGYATAEKFQMFAKAADISFNLRYPSAGETSRALLEALGEGACSIIFDYGTFADYPDEIVCKIPLDTANTEHLEAAILSLAKNPGLRESYQTKAKTYVTENHRIEDCVDLYAKIINQWQE